MAFPSLPVQWNYGPQGGRTRDEAERHDGLLIAFTANVDTFRSGDTVRVAYAAGVGYITAGQATNADTL